MIIVMNIVIYVCSQYIRFNLYNLKSEQTYPTLKYPVWFLKHISALHNSK